MIKIESLKNLRKPSKYELCSFCYEFTDRDSCKTIKGRNKLDRIICNSCLFELAVEIENIVELRSMCGEETDYVKWWAGKEINIALQQGRYIAAIKLYRDKTGSTLKEAKNYIDRIRDIYDNGD